MDRWKVGLFGQERINTFKGQLNDCKSTLNVAFVNGHHVTCLRPGLKYDLGISAAG